LTGGADVLGAVLCVVSFWDALKSIPGTLCRRLPVGSRSQKTTHIPARHCANLQN